jgi:hypothetical protein
MPLEGKQIQPRDLAELAHNQGWHGLDLVRMVATILSESQGYVAAYHDNLDSGGAVVSRDCGLAQINIAGRLIGSDEESKLRSDPVYNLQRAWELFTAAWTGGTTRRFQPWAGYTSGWAMFPEWYIWSQTDLVWKPTGRYLHRATRGVGNFYARELGVDLHGINLDWRLLASAKSSEPIMPTSPPTDGVGPRPTPNNGQ